MKPAPLPGNRGESVRGQCAGRKPGGRPPETGEIRREAGSVASTTLREELRALGPPVGGDDSGTEIGNGRVDPSRAWIGTGLPGLRPGGRIRWRLNRAV